MRVPVEWLQEYVRVKLKPKDLAHRLTMAGLEITGIIGAGHDTVLDIEVTPNRADCLSIIGVAREVAAFTGQRLTLPAAPASKPSAKTRLTIRVEDPRDCPRYIGRLIDGVTVTPSPDWMQRRLAACGIRPINNIVDITNYVLLEYGQPLHAFDADRLAESTIIVRRARPKELITTLDDVARTLSPDVLVIADANQAVAVAGIMGGKGSEVLPATTRLVLESAQFDPILIRRAGRTLGVTSESSYRFERGVDPAGVEAASARAAALIAKLSGGKTLTAQDVGSHAVRRTVIAVDEARVSRRLGVPVSASVIRSTLAGLSCRVASSSGSRALQAQVPSFRSDLVHEVDVIEELARSIGYDKIPAADGPVRISGGQDPLYARTEALRRLCAGLGLWEVMTWALIAEADLSHAGLPATGSELLKLSNPLSLDHAVLRPSLVPGLLRAAAKNLGQGAHGVRLFELGHTFSAAPAASQTLRLGLVVGGAWEHTWQSKTSADLFRLKGLVERLVEQSRPGAVSAAAVRLPWTESGQSMEVSLDGRRLGVIGQAARRIADTFHLEQPVWIAELDAGLLAATAPSVSPVAAPSQFPPVKRDLSFMIDRSVAYADLLGLIRRVAEPLAGRIELIDRYTGSQIPAAKHSLTFSIEYRDPRRTLTAEEVDGVHRALGDALARDFSAQLR